jgi:integrase
MPVDDLWFLTRRGPNDERMKAKRHGRGKRYRVRWVDDSGQGRTRLFERKADAELYDANVRADLSRGQYIDPSAGKITVRQFGERWRGEQLHRESTEIRTERAARLHIDTVLGDLPLNAVRPSHLKAWVKDRSQVLAPSTLHVVWAQLTSMFTAAAVDRMIGTSPCIGIRLPEIPRTDRFIPTPAQVHAIALSLAERETKGGPDVPTPGRRYAAVTYVGAGCGLRPGEILGLEVEHVDFLRREIHIRQQLITLPRRTPFLCPPKTSTSWRTVELPSVTAAALAEHIKAFPPVPVLVDDETDPRRPRQRQAKLLFTNARQQPINRSSWQRQWAPAVKLVAGIPEGFGLHGLRHYYATLLIHAGASVKTVQLALGHATPTITLNTYTHEWPDALDRTRTLVDSALGQTLAAALVKAV